MPCLMAVLFAGLASLLLFALPLQPETLKTAKIRSTDGCFIEAPIPSGWSFDGKRTMSISPTGVVSIQLHFDPQGAEIIIRPFTDSKGQRVSGAEEILSDIARFAEAKRATIEVEEFSTRSPHRQRLRVEFDEGPPWEGVRNVKTLTWACKGPVIVELRYHPASGKAAHWRKMLEGLLNGMRDGR